MNTKICFKCNKKKTLDKFYKHNQMADGHLNKCKICAKKDVQERYESPEGREYIRKYEKHRFQTKHRKEKVAEYQRKRRLLHRGKNLARQKAERAVSKGTIVKKSCEICGDINSQAHHSDYRKPLDVHWYCLKHHRELHKNRV